MSVLGIRTRDHMLAVIIHDHYSMGQWPKSNRKNGPISTIMTVDSKLDWK